MSSSSEIHKWLMHTSEDYRSLSKNDKLKVEHNHFWGQERRIMHGLHRLCEGREDKRKHYDSYDDWLNHNNSILTDIYIMFDLEQYIDYDDFCENRWRSIERVRELYSY
jgi:hypothetical protein